VPHVQVQPTLERFEVIRRAVPVAADDRVVDHDTGIASSCWRWKPGHDRIEPRPPVVPDPLGRELLGLDDWEHDR
jgi:hypothetical protein